VIIRIFPILVMPVAIVVHCRNMSYPIYRLLLKRRRPGSSLDAVLDQEVLLTLQNKNSLAEAGYLLLLLNVAPMLPLVPLLLLLPPGPLQLWPSRLSFRTFLLTLTTLKSRLVAIPYSHLPCRLPAMLTHQNQNFRICSPPP
jgi:hypothetical protein